MPKNLLLADDSVTIQKAVAITFAVEDYAVSVVGNGEDAVAKARAAKPDVILLDALMPKKSGYDACEALKADPALAGVPIILLAGTFEPFDEARARAVGADAFLQKPFESQALINKVRELVEGKAPVIAPGSTPLAFGTPVATPAVAAPPPAAPAPAFVAPRPQVPTAIRPAPGALAPAGARPPPGAMPPQVRPPAGAIPPAGARPPAGAIPPAGARPPAGAFPPAGARPPAGAFPPPGARPLPVAASTPTARPSAPPPPAAVPFAFAAPVPVPVQPPAAARPFTSPPQAASPFAPAAPPPGRRHPFGLDVAPPRPAQTATPASSTPFASDDDWSDIEVTPAGPISQGRPVEAVRPATIAPPPAPPRPVALAQSRPPEPVLELDATSGFEPIDLPAEEPGETTLLAPMHEFVPAAETTGHQPAPAAVAAPGLLSRAATADGGEAVLREALSRASREVIERVVWEVVPQLAETIIRENLDRLTRARQG